MSQRLMVGGIRFKNDVVQFVFDVSNRQIDVHRQETETMHDLRSKSIQ